MKMFIIPLNHLAGVELILTALRERTVSKGCIASGQLADGIEGHLLTFDTKTGVMEEIERVGEVKEDRPAPPKLGLVSKH